MGGGVLIWDANVHFFHTDCYTGRRVEYVGTIFIIAIYFVRCCLGSYTPAFSFAPWAEVWNIREYLQRKY
jgi:hypothetical protein